LLFILSQTQFDHCYNDNKNNKSDDQKKASRMHSGTRHVRTKLMSTNPKYMAPFPH